MSLRKWAVGLLSAALLGCSVAAHRPADPSTRPVTTADHVLQFSRQSVPIDKLRDNEHDIDLQNVLSFGATTGDIYFGQRDEIGDKDQTISTVPLIVAMQKGVWLALSLADVRLPNAQWQFVATGPADGEIWGILDDQLDDNGRTILLAHSTDTGATWRVRSINKPFGSGQYDSFRMDEAGHGRLTVYVDGTRRHPERAGFYHFHTSDRGQNWAAPVHEPDALTPADDVPDDQEPEPLKTSPTQTAMLGR